MEEDATEVTKREGPTSAKSARPPKGQEYLERGTLVGRYVVLDRLGEGGMGVVYRAFDPELDRKVAIKLLQANEAAGSTGGGQAWLVREAQALARLSHPNVVAVHDVGTLAGDQVFVAMELVDGMTLRAWLRQKERTWREVREVALAAGAGLAAAHKAGLVHRDFKPENVLVGSDGRVRVMDFGLARLNLDELEDTDREISAKSPLSDVLTVAGAAVGTPAYMAPEIYRGDSANERSDQFSFGVTLFEMLYGGRPYDRSELAKEPERAKPRFPADAKVPARLERLVLRAIAIDPAQRFGSLDELLAELAIDPTARRRRALIGGGAALAIAAAIAGMTMVVHAKSKVCTGADHRLVGVWDDAAKAKIKAGYLASKLPYAASAYDAMAKAVDAYANQWVAAAIDSCEATRVRGEQTEQILALRQTCLDQRLYDLGALARVLAEPNQLVIGKADKVASELEPVSRCSNIAALQDPKQPPPEIAIQVRQMQIRLADVKALVIAGRYLELLTLSAELEKMAEKLDWKPMEAEVQMIRGIALGAAGSYDASIAAFEEATWAGEAARRDEIVANSALTIAWIAAEGNGKLPEAKVWFAFGKAATRRYGNDRLMNWRVLQIEGLMDALSGDVTAAVEAHSRMLSEAIAIYGPDSPNIWEDQELFATTLTKAGRWGDAVPHYERALALRMAAVGDSHQDIALILSNLGACYSYTKDPRWKPTFERALELRKKLFGKDSPILAPTLNNYADALSRMGDPISALPFVERADQLAQGIPGKEHYMWHQIATDHAEILIAASRLPEARKILDEALALEEHTKSVVIPQTEAVRAELELSSHAWADAIAWAQKSMAGYEAAGGKDNPEMWRPLAALGRAQLELGKRDEARASLDRALAIVDKLRLDMPQVDAARAARKRL